MYEMRVDGFVRTPEMLKLVKENKWKRLYWNWHIIWYYIKYIKWSWRKLLDWWLWLNFLLNRIYF